MASVAFVPAPAEGLNHPNVLEMFAARAKRTPDLPALRFKRHGIWRALTWRDWQRAGEALAAGFIARLGVQRGTRIALMAPTRVEWALCDLGIAMAGAVSVPIYPSATPEQAAHIVRDSGAEIAIVADAPQARRLRAAATGLQHVLVLDDPGPTDIGLDLLQAEGEGQLARLRPVLTAIAAELGHADPFTFVYTSGTTGVPKGVVLSHKNFVYEAWAIKNVVAADRSDEQLMVLPLAHVFARHLLWGAVEQGAVTAFAPAASTAALTTAFQEVAPTYMCAVPRVYDRFYNQILAEVQAGGVVVRAAFERCMEVGRKVSMCRQRGQSLPGALALKMNLADRLFFNKIKQQFGGRLRFFVSGGAPLRREVAEFFHAIGVLILEGYGLTETTGATHVNRPDRFRFGTVGPAMPGCELRIAEDGEILIRGPGVMQGYHGLPEDTAAALDAAGWLHTGDIGELRDGFLAITDRKKDIIITSNGKNIAPLPLEGRLELAEGIAHALVIGDGRPHLVALIGLDVPAMLAVARREGLGCRTVAELARHPRIHQLVQIQIDRLNADLASYEAIRRFVIAPFELSEASGELTPTLKLRRREVAVRHAALIDTLYT
ncbi:long-chain fatty acid--CoA ligase [Nannocystis sp.]|uniref:AMP-dependent synthetase/ligase n=1 Tax=Nannocystis sp. TaxID=1962667 RepID=UPI002425DD39|nr:long-chain fatty acid--CoA ligase [Nannocystis sp.]MBK7824176.1 long-chain fatty acid--CoA ligase [Nannocystis sp.]MBK9755189.1 long-chain fatty acid--CoA ligase [Nannocystis sp.]